jgi:hypothetical protein
LRHLQKISEGRGYKTIWIEASEDAQLQDVLVPALKTTLERMSFGHLITEKLKYATHRLGVFASRFKASYQDITVSMIETKTAPLTNDFEGELHELLRAISDVAQEKETALTIHIDEMQFLPEKHLEALYKALHLLGQEAKPIMLIGAGLPQIQAKSGIARSYAERLFTFKYIARLSVVDSKNVLSQPAQKLNVIIVDDALEYITARTNGYPFFLQQYGYDLWNISPFSPITLDDALIASQKSESTLDESFFKVRFNRLTPYERKYLRAMAEFGDKPVRSGDIATLLKRDVKNLSPMRNKLINKGVIYSPAYGDTAFTVPLFDEFLKRVMPTLD